jgi:hypothetical protein
MFLWVDPNNDGRALLFISTPNINADTVPNLLIVDISRVPQGGAVTEVTEGNWNDRYPGTNQANYPFDPNSPDGCGPYDCNLFVHSMGVKPDGTLTFLALEAGHFLVLDTSQVVAGVPNPQLVLLTDPRIVLFGCRIRSTLPPFLVNSRAVARGRASVRFLTRLQRTALTAIRR